LLKSLSQTLHRQTGNVSDEAAGTRWLKREFAHYLDGPLRSGDVQHFDYGTNVVKPKIHHRSPLFPHTIIPKIRSAAIVTKHDCGHPLGIILLDERDCKESDEVEYRNNPSLE
jgi:hypothetical protein